jgi:hypothetical protein
MRPAAVVLGLVSCFGCGFKSSAVSGDGSLDGTPSIDAADAPVLDGPDAPAGDDLVLSGTVTYDTGSHTLKVNNVTTPAMHMTITVGADSFDAIVAHDVHLVLGTSLKATGGAPLVIVAQHDITIDANASIDVSDGGAGMLPNCSTAPQTGGDDNNGAGGGGGGSFIGTGGHGGAGHDGRAAGGPGGGSISAQSGLQGGCPGARGGAGTGAGGAPGRGGGAIYLKAGNRIQLGADSLLLASGAGGHAGPAGSNGGGGGGSGGMLWLEANHIIAPSMSPSARLIANGGGGGGGGSSNAAGTDGNPGTTTAVPATGGPGAPGCSSGGNGGSRSSTIGGDVGATVGVAGGGGGGGVGLIFATSPDLQIQAVTLSPDRS